MEKQKIISITSIIIIIAIVCFSSVNIYALGNLEIKGIDNSFRLFEMSTDDTIKICNNSPVPVFFHQFNFVIFFDGEPLGVFVINPENIMPYSKLEADGKYISDSMAQSQSIFMHFDHMFSSDGTIRIDPNKMSIITQFHTNIIGIPYVVSEKYNSVDFWNMLNEQSNSDC
ncbi:hypothetical protein AAA799E16_01914 [Marine Group I thaumarchaeote SCGC AAA799-E16]|uniref:Uncharacterized protein n=4 Tax=Marine Group I TaxID=905826 RepID=A0A087S5U1_9ARCH|nr:hypothetical protein AAA799E16_01914 [Marine Group I thaumarchaeote SCGC AAA799-E16]KFM15690.1 hypothetical protein AAA799D11_01092 [Marine Group I thaumarchaeote SCGC AAA799-D11]KFM16306.1 hypothetical protein SCCGRSA3_02399 [Marine Group I thaumarchaeote SCGC RSA3]KFM21095.1 hypothetical protein AAA799B03_01382 [Marine Group I thaumarchaeote SCGC AAA799-B03]